MTQDNIPDIGPQQLDAILRFLPFFERPGYVFGEWHGRAGQWPYYTPSRRVASFVQALYDEHILFSFDWPSWQAEADRYVSDPEAVRQADLLTCRKLLTTHVRADRFSEGHLAKTLECGHITEVLRRLKALRAEMGAPQPGA